MASINVVRKKSSRVAPTLRLQFDYWLLLSLAGLLILGLLMVYSSSFDYGLQWKNGDITYFLRRQLQAAGLGLLSIIVIMQVDYHIFRRFSVPLMIGTLILLVAVLFVGEETYGARRALFGSSIQPSEIAKLAMIIYIAHWISSKGERIRNWAYGLVPFGIITGVVCALVVSQPDLSTALLIAFISLTMFFIAGADLKQFFLVGLLGGTAFTFVMVTLPHASQRLVDYWQSLFDPSLASHHSRQAMVALAHGGFSGVGIGQGVQKFSQLPLAHSDGIFAVIGEEFGFIGTVAVIILLGIFIWRGFRMASKARDEYGFLLGVGITCWLAYQALINMAVITNLIPFTGMPLPFISYGGSSLAISLTGVGILLNISRDQALRTRPQPERRPRRN